MIGRRLAALLCVLLAHALVVYLLLSMSRQLPARQSPAEFVSEPITFILPSPEEASQEAPAVHQPTADHPQRRAEAQSAGPSAAPAAAPDAHSPPAYVDWPIEARKSAARVLAREAEAERVARMFAGPGGTWASLTKRQRSKLNKFRWRPGVLGLEYDDKGNQIYHLSDGCVIVNSGFIACAIGKVTVHGDMFENMRQYFDEQRLPETDEGNGTEPEALRPPH
jgi:hypothetical protein